MSTYSTLRGSPIDRLMELVECVESGCWIYTGHKKNRYGYAQISATADGRTKQLAAHRLAYEHFVGPIPDGLELDHLCKTPPCVNPDHLEPVTRAENNRRKRTETCAQGHPRDGNRLPQGQCKICHSKASTIRNREHPLRPCGVCKRPTRTKGQVCRRCVDLEMSDR